MKCNATRKEILTTLDRMEQELQPLEPLPTIARAFVDLEESVDIIPLPAGFIPSDISALFSEGVPLLHSGEILVYPEPMIEVWQQVCELASDHLTEQQELLAKYAAWPKDDEPGWAGMMGQYFLDGDLPQDQEERDLLTFVLVHTWRPFLLKWVADLPALPEGLAWRQPLCPVCGGQPDFAYLGAEAGERYLVCARCDTSWHYHRLGCPFCNARESSDYGFHPQDDERYRLYACNNCRRYLKTLDMRQASGEPLLQIERILTAAMDVAALKEGYSAI